MNIMVLTLATYPDVDRQLAIFKKSCEKFGVPDVHYYGLGRTYDTWSTMKIRWQLDYLKEHGYSHILYTDSRDAFFCRPWKELVDNYIQMGKPPFLASSHDGTGNVPRPPERYGMSERYPCVGGYLADRDLLIDTFERMLKLPEQSGDDVFHWYDAMHEGWFKPVLDNECRIFRVWEPDREIGDACIFHLSGGYTDPITGKDERLIPWAQKLGVL